MCVLPDTGDSSVKTVLLATKGIQPDWGLLGPVSLVTAREEVPVTPTQVSQVNPGPASDAQGLGGWGVELSCMKVGSYLCSLQRWERIIRSVDRTRCLVTTEPHHCGVCQSGGAGSSYRKWLYRGQDREEGSVWIERGFGELKEL